MPLDSRDSLHECPQPMRELAIAPPDGILASDYHLIEDAVMETARGRWFLREYARRIRAAETVQVLEMLTRIEAGLAARRSIGAIASGTVSLEQDTGKAGGSEDAGQVGDDAEAIRQVHEKLLDIVWQMRERGFDGQVCSAIRREAEKLVDVISGGQAKDKTAGKQAGQAALLSAAQAASIDRQAVPVRANKAGSGGDVRVDDETRAMQGSIARLKRAAGETMPTDIAGADSQQVEAGSCSGDAAARDEREAGAGSPQLEQIAGDDSALSRIDELNECERLALFS